MDTEKSRQPGDICDDNVGNMAPVKPVRLYKPCCTSDQIAMKVKERLGEFLDAHPPKSPTMLRTRVK